MRGKRNLEWVRDDGRSDTFCIPHNSTNTSINQKYILVKQSREGRHRVRICHVLRGLPSHLPEHFVLPHTFEAKISLSRRNFAHTIILCVPRSRLASTSHDLLKRVKPTGTHARAVQDTLTQIGMTSLGGGSRGSGGVQPLRGFRGERRV